MQPIAVYDTSVSPKSYQGILIVQPAIFLAHFQ